MSTLLVLLCAASFATAQQSQAVCTKSSAQWVFNSLGQSPCTVAGYLGSLCTSTGKLVVVPPLTPGNHYLGPNALNSNNACKCSSVFYSMLAACSICQSKNYLGWSKYMENCTTVYPGFFPTELPAGTSVPNYAYQDVVRADSFDPTRAQQSPTAPESTGTALPTGTATAGGDSGAGSGSGSGSGSGGKGKGKVRKALGGVAIGIIVACFVVATFIFTVAGWYIRRRRRNQACAAPPPQPSKADYGPVPVSTPFYPAQTSYSYTPYTPPPAGNFHDQSIPTNYSPAQSPAPNYIYYDPSNPSTYNTMAAPTTHAGYTDYHPQPGYTYYPPNQGRYSVVPQAG